MARIVTAFIVMGCTFVFVACASQQTAENAPPQKLEGIVLAKGIDHAGVLGIPLGETTDFTVEDGQVAAMLTFENFSGSHDIRWEWIDPDGQVYISTGNYPLEAGKGKYLPKVTVSHHISIKDEEAAEIPGQWSVDIFVDDEMIASKSFFVDTVADPILLPPGVAARPYPEDWGLIIGIEAYHRLPNVEYARKDALIVQDYFNRILGVPQENIIMLIDGDATKASIEGYLKNYIPTNVGKDTTLYVYFAGHGMPGAKEGEPYLVPYDADTRFIEQTGYKLVSFYEDVNQIDVQRSYVFLDSCFSGVASRAADMLVQGARPALIHVENVKPPSGTIVSFNATSTGELSNAYPEKEHGLFTYYLLRGLKGEADTDDDGWTSVKEIYGYVRSHVMRESRRMQSEQTPILLPSVSKIKDVVVSRSVR
jgi:hypothetical protein